MYILLYVDEILQKQSRKADLLLQDIKKAHDLQESQYYKIML
jgi:hypothetical protein